MSNGNETKMPQGVIIEDHVLLRVPENIKTLDLTGVNITEIGEGAFEHCDIEHLAIPEGVTAIRDRAFANCRNLMSVELPQSLSSIGEEAFWFCQNLRVIGPFPFPFTEIPESAFEGCVSLEM